MAIQTVRAKIQVFVNSFPGKDDPLSDEGEYCAVHLGVTRLANDPVTAGFWLSNLPLDDGNKTCTCLTLECLLIEKIEGTKTTHHFVYYHNPLPESFGDADVMADLRKMFKEMETVSKSILAWAVLPLPAVKKIADAFHCELPADFGELSSLTIELMDDGSIQIYSYEVVRCQEILANRPQADGNN
jgi:hypothetical protein